MLKKRGYTGREYWDITDSRVDCDQSNKHCYHPTPLMVAKGDMRLLSRGADDPSEARTFISSTSQYSSSRNLAAPDMWAT
jgi:hypothetical protein